MFNVTEVSVGLEPVSKEKHGLHFTLSPVCTYFHKLLYVSQGEIVEEGSLVAALKNTSSKRRSFLHKLVSCIL